MKLLIAPCIVLFSLMLWQDNRTILICQTWRQVGTKQFGKAYQQIDPSTAEVVAFKKDGTYEEVLYGQLKMKGKWKLDTRSAKLAFEITEMNGVPMTDMSLDTKHPTDSILKLTKDTLIYGKLKYFGKDKVYGHDDMYFVKQ